MLFKQETRQFSALTWQEALIKERVNSTGCLFFNSNEFSQVCDSKFKWQCYVGGQQIRQSTLQWFVTVPATFWAISKCIQVSALALESNETKRREGLWPHSEGRPYNRSVLAQRYTLHSGGLEPAPHTNWSTKSTFPSAATWTKERAHSNGRKFWLPVLKTRQFYGEATS